MRFNNVSVRVERDNSSYAIRCYARLAMPRGMYVECRQMVSHELVREREAELQIAEHVSRALARGLTEAFMTHARTSDDMDLRGYDARMVYEELLVNIRAQMFRATSPDNRHAQEYERERMEFEQRLMAMLQAERAVHPPVMLGRSPAMDALRLTPGSISAADEPITATEVRRRQEERNHVFTREMLEEARRRLQEASDANPSPLAGAVRRDGTRFVRMAIEEQEELSRFDARLVRMMPVAMGFDYDFVQKEPESRLKKYKAPKFKLSEAPIIKEVMPGLTTIPKEDLEERVLVIMGEK